MRHQGHNVAGICVCRRECSGGLKRGRGCNLVLKKLSGGRAVILNCRPTRPGGHRVEVVVFLKGSDDNIGRPCRRRGRAALHRGRVGGRVVSRIRSGRGVNDVRAGEDRHAATDVVRYTSRGAGRRVGARRRCQRPTDLLREAVG